MNRVCIALLFFLSIPATALADSILTIGQITISYTPPASTNLAVYSPQLDTGYPFRVHPGKFTDAVTTLMCVNAACTSLSIDLSVSGITIDHVRFQGVMYPTLYLSGTLDIRGILPRGFAYCYPGTSCFQGVSLITGNLIACTDPACSTQLFQLDANLHAMSNVSIGFNAQGQPVLDTAGFVAPEPTTMLLLATGLAGIGWRKYRAGLSQRQQYQG